MKAIPNEWSQVGNVWYRNWRQFIRSWSISLFWILLEPTVILGSIGFGIGAYITQMGGVSYADFFFPALLCSTTMMVSYFEATYSNFSKLTYQQVYRTILLAPVETRELVAGEILWAATKGTISSVGIVVVAAPMGLIDSWRIIPAFAGIFMTALVFAALGMLVTSIVKNYDQIIYPTSGLIVPMSLLSGTYFPIDQLPIALKYAVYLLPLTHSVAMVRGMLLKGFEWMQLYHFLVLFIVFIPLFRTTVKRIHRKLVS